MQNSALASLFFSFFSPKCLNLWGSTRTDLEHTENNCRLLRFEGSMVARQIMCANCLRNFSSLLFPFDPGFEEFSVPYTVILCWTLHVVVHRAPILRPAHTRLMPTASCPPQCEDQSQFLSSRQGKTDKSLCEVFWGWRRHLQVCVRKHFLDCIQTKKKYRLGRE